MCRFAIINSIVIVLFLSMMVSFFLWVRVRERKREGGRREKQKKT
jgi:hypothetical protein